MSETASTLFVDTSIVIAETIHSPRTKARIRERKSGFAKVVTGSVVREEYKRRLLREAAYLLATLKRVGTYEALSWHLSELPPLHNRKRSICQGMLLTVFPEASGEELTERLQLYLEDLLDYGMDDLELLIDEILPGAQCGLSIERPLRKKSGSYEIGGKKCEQAKGCEVAKFIGQLTEPLKRLRDELNSCSGEDNAPPECAKWIKAIDQLLAQPAKSRGLNPCLTIGDVMIALESSGTPTFYTMNGRDSIPLCRALQQTLVIRPKNPQRDDRIIEGPTAS